MTEVNKTATLKGQNEAVAVVNEPEGVAPFAFTIFAVAVLYYSFAYLLRVYPGVMEYELSQRFHITASSFGLLTSFYYFAYAPMQIPVGVSVDRIGPRRSLMTACAIATTGAFLFSTSTSYNLALLGRFMIGMGSSFAYVTALKLSTIWLPPRFFGTAAGVLTGVGMFAAILTDVFLTRLISSTGFTNTLQIPIFIGLVLFVLIFMTIRDKPSNGGFQANDETASVSIKQLSEYLVKFVKSPQMWLIGIIGSLMYLPSSTFLDVWAIPYLKRSYGMTAEQASYGTSLMFLGWIVSTLSVGAVSDIFQNRRAPLKVATFLAFVVSCVLFYAPDLSIFSVFCLMFSLGVCCGPHPLCFTLSKELFPKKVAGSAIAFANCCIMLGGLIFQPVVGKLLDWQWAGGMQDGVRIYSSHNYMLSLSVIPMALLISFFLTYLIKDTQPEE